eukprot:6210948-Pleurochrysis_carterae.AAC.2
MMRAQGIRRSWFENQLLFFLSGNATSAFFCLIAAGLKLSTADLRLVLGVSSTLTISVACACVSGVATSSSYLLWLSNSFMKGLSSDVSVSSSMKVEIELARAIFICGSFLIGSTAMYMILELTVSPQSGRNLHYLCNKSAKLQSWFGHVLIAISVAMMTFVLVRCLNQALRARRQLAKRTDSTEIQREAEAMRWTRGKVIVLPPAAAFLGTVLSGSNISYAFDQSKPPYTAYGLGVQLIVLLCVGLHIVKKCIALSASSAPATTSISLRSSLDQAQRPSDGEGADLTLHFQNEAVRLDTASATVSHRRSSASLNEGLATIPENVLIDTTDLVNNRSVSTLEVELQQLPQTRELPEQQQQGQEPRQQRNHQVRTGARDRQLFSSWDC